MNLDRPDKKVSIAIVTPTFPPYRGGIGKLAELDARQLASLGYDVHVFVPAPRRPIDRPEASFTVHDLRPWLRFGNAALVPGAAAVPSGFRLVFLHYPFFGGAEPAALAARFSRGSKLALVYHMDVVGRGLVGTFFRLHRRLLQPLVLRSADRIVVTSFDYLLDSHIGGLFRQPRFRFRELAPSVDTGRFRPDDRPAELMARYGLTAQDRVVLFVGGLDQAHYFKGVPILLQSLATRELAETKAIIVGDGDLRPELEKQAADLGLAGRAIFAGSVSDDELPGHYRLADVFAFPSIDRSEAFGIAALEALASGLPVVSSDLPGVRTIVRHGETGFRVPPGSVSALVCRLDELLDDDVMRCRFAAAARKMAVEEYDDAIRLKRLGQLVSDLISGPEPERRS